MGTWGVGTFDNDTACDWKYDLESADDLSLVAETFGAVLVAGDDYLDSDAACNGLAACEVVARLKGNWGPRNSYTESLDKWVMDHPQSPPDDVVRDAIAVIDRVLTQPSELVALWEDNADFNAAWKESVKDLRQRVAA
jgi:hypothetical protein